MVIALFIKLSFWYLHGDDCLARLLVCVGQDIHLANNGRHYLWYVMFAIHEATLTHSDNLWRHESYLSLSK